MSMFQAPVAPIASVSASARGSHGCMEQLALGFGHDTAMAALAAEVGM